MRNAFRRKAPWLAAWLAITVLGGIVLGRLELEALRDAFETDARIAHRLLSQRVVQHDAVLATLALLQPAPDHAQAEQRLPSVYPQIIRVQRRGPGQAWPDERLAAAEMQSARLKRSALAGAELAAGRYQLVIAAAPAAFAVLIDLRAVVPWSEWPMQPAASPVRVTLEHAGQAFVVQPGNLAKDGWRFDFHKHLAADSQPFDVVATRQVRWAELPWGWMVGWSIGTALMLAALSAWRGQRAGRRRAEELLRLGQVARLNALGELAAGMAHELNQPLTAVLANTQAASRLLADEPPEVETARSAMAQAVEQARRASAVVARMRRAVERPDLAAQLQPVVLQEAVRNALDLLEPELARRQVVSRLDAGPAPVTVLADPVALEQVIHNLLMNALQALEQVPARTRLLSLAVAPDGRLTVQDSGPGIAADVLPRVFEPFFTTRADGLGLGLSLCETLATGMGGQLTVAAATPQGAVFTLALPLAAA